MRPRDRYRTHRYTVHSYIGFFFCLLQRLYASKPVCWCSLLSQRFHSPQAPPGRRSRWRSGLPRVSSTPPHSRLSQLQYFNHTWNEYCVDHLVQGVVFKKRKLLISSRRSQLGSSRDPVSFAISQFQNIKTKVISHIMYNILTKLGSISQYLYYTQIHTWPQPTLKSQKPVENLILQKCIC